MTRAAPSEHSVRLQVMAWLCATLGSACSASDLTVAEWVPPKPATGQYLEAESGLLSAAGFMIGVDDKASGGSYLFAAPGPDSDAMPGSARATYDFTLTQAGTYLIWGRIQSHTTSDNRFWFQLDGGTWRKWRISVGEIWFWDAFHDDTNYGVPLTFPLTPGPHQLVLADCVPNARLDRLYITADGDTPPGNDTPCTPPHSIETAGVCQPSCGSQHGTTCGASACQGQPALPAYDCDICCVAPPLDAGTNKPDAGPEDAGKADAGQLDAGRLDAGHLDAGKSDAGKSDAGKSDAGKSDASNNDTGDEDAG